MRWQVSPEPKRITGALSSTDLDEIKTIAHREIFKVYHSLAGHSVKSVEVTSNLMVDRLSRAPDGKVIRSLEVTTNLSVDVSYVDNESLFGECTMMLEKGANGWTFIAHNCR